MNECFFSASHHPFLARRCRACRGRRSAGDGLLFGPEPVKVDGHYGAASLLPAVVAILLAFLTHQVLFALLIGIFMGGLVVSDINILGRFMIPAIGSEQYALILLV